MIGTGATLPDPATPGAGITAWLVPSANAQLADKFYLLADDDGTPVWLDQSHRLLRETDPVLFANDSVSELQDLAGGSVAAGAEASFTSATSWQMDHTLTRTPHVAAVDSAGRQLLPQIEHVSTTRVLVTHNTPQSGTLRIS